MILPLAAVGAASGTLAWGTYAPASPLFGRVTARGSRQGRSLYLTFDDGPRPGVTERILETLARESVPAAFFLVGATVRRHPGAARDVAAAGHEIGNHTRSHRKLHRLGPARIRDEIVGGHRDIVEVTGEIPRAFRAPHGYRNPFVARVARRLRYRTFGWTFGVWDSDRPPAEEIRRRVRAKLRPGAIILLHDGDGYDPEGVNPHGDRTPTAEALPGIIADARAAGYAFHPLAELLG
jgi:peptidoglycan-N-acetylglucosamine deacetylase